MRCRTAAVLTVVWLLPENSTWVTENLLSIKNVAVSVYAEQLDISIVPADVRNLNLLLLAFRNMNILLPEGKFLIA